MQIRSRLGFMQGRLSPLVDGKIQAFPWNSWQSEFPAAQNLGLGLIEWTLDQDRLYQNPLMTPQGQLDIRRLCEAHHLVIPSLTGDCFMQAVIGEMFTTSLTLTFLNSLRKEGFAGGRKITMWILV